MIGPLIAVAVALRSDAGRGEDPPKPFWLAVAKGDFVGPLQPLAAMRRQEGFQTAVSSQSVEKALAEAPRQPDFLLLVGDDEPGGAEHPWFLPARRMDLYRWRRVQRQQYASDAAWGDLDGDLVPDVAVGRIPARTPGDVERAVQKILAFARRPVRQTDLQLVVWAGSPAYGAAIDALATELLLTTVRTNGPRWIRPWIISGNPSHPLCGWPPDQPGRFTRQIRQGGLLAVLMGHASAERFFSLAHEGQSVGYAAADAQDQLAQGPPALPMVFFSCESGDFTRPTPCMAESFFSFPGGPVATIAATTESHPLTNYFWATCLLTELDGKEDRIGRIWLAAQRRALKARNFLVERILRDVEGKLEEEIDLAKLRRDQVLMYAVLGDPATRLRRPRPLEATIRRTDEGWQWKATRPPGAVRLAVGHRWSKLPVPRVATSPLPRPEAQAAFEAANAALDFAPLPPPPDQGPWEGTVEQPGWLRLVAIAGGELYVAVLRIE